MQQRLPRITEVQLGQPFWDDHDRQVSVQRPPGNPNGWVVFLEGRHLGGFDGSADEWRATSHLSFQASPVLASWQDAVIWLLRQ